jgi:hypothetical protein
MHVDAAVPTRRQQDPLAAGDSKRENTSSNTRRTTFKVDVVATKCGYFTWSDRLGTKHVAMPTTAVLGAQAGPSHGLVRVAHHHLRMQARQAHPSSPLGYCFSPYTQHQLSDRLIRHFRMRRVVERRRLSQHSTRAVRL